MVRKRKRQRQPENELPFQKLREDANLSQEELAVRIGLGYLPRQSGDGKKVMNQR